MARLLLSSKSADTWRVFGITSILWLCLIFVSCKRAQPTQPPPWNTFSPDQKIPIIYLRDANSILPLKAAVFDVSIQKRTPSERQLFIIWIHAKGKNNEDYILLDTEAGEDEASRAKNLSKGKEYEFPDALLSR